MKSGREVYVRCDLRGFRPFANYDGSIEQGEYLDHDNIFVSGGSDDDPNLLDDLTEEETIELDQFIEKKGTGIISELSPISYEEYIG